MPTPVIQPGEASSQTVPNPEHSTGPPATPSGHAPNKHDRECRLPRIPRDWFNSKPFSAEILAHIRSLDTMSTEWFPLVRLLHEKAYTVKELSDALSDVREILGVPLAEFIEACEPGFLFEDDREATEFMRTLVPVILMATGKFAAHEVALWVQLAPDRLLDKIETIMGREDAFVLRSLMHRLRGLAKEPAVMETWEDLRPLFAPLAKRDYIVKQEEAIRAIREIVGYA